MAQMFSMEKRSQSERSNRPGNGQHHGGTDTTCQQRPGTHVRNSPAHGGSIDSLLAMANFGTHPPLFAADLATPFTSFFRPHARLPFNLKQ